MTERTVSHATFVIERAYEAPPERVFAAWTSPEVKSQWFGNVAKPDPDYQLEASVQDLCAAYGFAVRDVRHRRLGYTAVFTTGECSPG